MNTFLTRILNTLCGVLLTQEEQSTYPQIYPNYYFSVRYFVLFEALTYVALASLFWGTLENVRYAYYIVGVLILGGVEFFLCRTVLAHTQWIENTTTRNVIFVLHNVIWLTRVLMWASISAALLAANPNHLMLLIAMFFLINAIILSTSSFFFRTYALLLTLYVSVFIHQMYHQPEHSTLYIITLLACAIVLLYFGRVQRNKLMNVITHTARSQSLVRSHQQSITQLQQFYRQQSRYLSAASHDLRQPLHALALVVNGTLRQADSPFTQHALHKIESTVEHLTDSFNAMLQLSRFDSEALTPNIQATFLQDLFRQVQDELAPIAQQKNIRLRIQSPNAWVYTDRAILIVVLKHLIHYLMQVDGAQTILMGVRRRMNDTHVYVYCRNEHAQLLPDNYDDTVTELDSTQLSLNIALVQRFCRILDHPFLPIQTHRYVKRLGIGLPLCSPAAIDSMRHLTTQPITSTATQSTPTKTPSISALTTQNLSTPMIHTNDFLVGKTVIVIDDDPVIADGIEQLLDSWGMIVSMALSTEMVLELIDDEGPVDFLVTDYHLGDIGETGLDIIKMSKTQFPKTLCILVTGDTTTDLAEQSHSWVDLMVYKPIRPARLRNQLNQLWASHTKSY